MSVETGVPPDRLAELDGFWLDALVDSLRRRAAAMTGDEYDDEPSLDWDAMHPQED